MTQPTADAFRAVMGRFATGVTVMTTTADDGPHGMTANAVSSVSLEPLLVLVCVERRTAMAELAATSGHFGLSILTHDQVALSNRFADPDRPTGAAQFEGVAVHDGPAGSPLLQDALAWLDCTVWAEYDGGDHVIVVGEVAGLGAGTSGDALVYYGSRYVRLRAPDAADVEEPPD